MECRHPTDTSNNGNAAGGDRRVHHLKKLFVDDLSHDWSLDEMAERVNISASHLGRLFRSQTGLPPKAYLQHLRLEHAARLLRETFLTIKQIRLHIGYTDKTMFIKTFKTKYGTTPNEYRKSPDKYSDSDRKA